MPITAEYHTQDGQPLIATAPIGETVRVIPIPSSVDETATMNLTSFAEGGAAIVFTYHLKQAVPTQKIVLNANETLPKTIVGQEVIFRGQ